MHAIVTFRTLPNGSYSYMRGLKRGYWRVMIVTEYRATPRITDQSTLCVRETSSGIDGVTPRSKYYIGDNKRICDAIAEYANALITKYQCDATPENAAAILSEAAEHVFAKFWD